MIQIPKAGTRLRLIADRSKCGTFVRERHFGGVALWTVRAEDGGYWVYAPEEWELESHAAAT